MYDHQFLVLGWPHIQFDAIGSQFEGFCEGRNRVFRRVSAVAAVGGHQWEVE